MGNQLYKVKVISSRKKSISSRKGSMPKSNDEKEQIKLRALYDYESREGYDLSFQENDILIALEDPKGKLWFQAFNMRTKIEGLIPYNYVVVEDGSPNSLDCFYDINRVQAERILQMMGNPEGTYLIRPSADKPNIALSVRMLDSDKIWTIRHFIIRKATDQWYLNPERMFPNVQTLLHYYTETETHRMHKLFQPLPRNERPVVQFKDLEVDRKNFIKEEFLDKGSFGEVWKARWAGSANSFVAVKVIQRSTISNENFLNEAKILHSLRHPRIVKLMGISTNPKGEPVLIVTEFMANGSLQNFFKTTSGKSLNLRNLIDIIAQISEGMAYLESKKFIHRDLRSENILVDSNNFVKVANFGLARVIEDDSTIQDSKFPVRWTAPEAALEGKFTIKSDVWSFGILMFEIITYGGTPYAHLQTKEVAVEVIQNNYRISNPHGRLWNGMKIECPSDLYNIMFNCWNKVPDSRPTFESLMNTFTEWGISTEGHYGQ